MAVNRTHNKKLIRRQVGSALDDCGACWHLVGAGGGTKRNFQHQVSCIQIPDVSDVHCVLSSELLDHVHAASVRDPAAERLPLSLGSLSCGALYTTPAGTWNFVPGGAA
jgi:hypothetical protein